jgi:ATP-dependent RNA helicase RhlE
MDLIFLISQIGKRDQTLLFSATIDTTLKTQIDELMYEPLEIKVSRGVVSAEHIAQDVVYATKEDKFSKLLEMVNDASFEKVLVFAETKRNVGRVAKQLNRAGISVDEIHGDKTLGYRKKALNSFKQGKVKVLVATDVAARGLDIDNVTHVINYEIPHDYETYIHRIGRTGRLGKKGFAYTFIN